MEFKAGLISEKTLFQSLNSYLGVFSHANCHDLEQDLKNKFWFWLWNSVIGVFAYLLSFYFASFG